MASNARKPKHPPDSQIASNVSNDVKCAMGKRLVRSALGTR